jgi:hypothetical protein
VIREVFFFENEQNSLYGLSAIKWLQIGFLLPAELPAIS